MSKRRFLSERSFVLLPAPYNTRHVRRLHPGVLPRACNSYGSTAKGRLSYESYSPVLHRALGITREKNQIKKKIQKKWRFTRERYNGRATDSKSGRGSRGKKIARAARPLPLSLAHVAQFTASRVECTERKLPSPAGLYFLG